ncbi:hypothetical protein [Baekduia alba]|uniref:hypothetical protein n=1 Tax=Baekduia alba TaxID=2997333 RepID=UPI0023414EA6|nr:hypothetical protein [Baekduia alba]
MRRSATSLLCAALLAVLVGCGDDADSSSGAKPKGDAALRSDPPLARAPRRAGEVVLRANASPQAHGPVALDGRYRVRFVQYAPEDPTLDFTTQTAFVADLQTPAGRPAEPLFKAAAAAGATTIDVHGRFLVDVSFGDFPYVLRFSPAGK